MIEHVDTGLWIADGNCVSFYGFAYPTRSAIVRLSNGDLWVWSPIELTPDLQQSVDALGPVRHLISPNKLHHLYLQDWKAAYPEARYGDHSRRFESGTTCILRGFWVTNHPPNGWPISTRLGFAARLQWTKSFFAIAPPPPLSLLT